MRKKQLRALLSACAVGLFLAGPAEMMAQTVTVRIGQGTLDQAFQQIMKTSNIQLVYNADVAARIRCRGGEFSQTDIARVLDTLLAGTQLTYEVKDGIYTITRRTAQSGPQQRETVRGKVLDENGDPVIGAAVRVKGSTQSMATDVDGNFLLQNVKGGGGKITLTVSYIGKKTIERDVEPGLNTVFHLEEDASMMNEVVVTGYQDIAKEKMTGSVTTIRADVLEERYTPSLLSNLEGRVAGLTTYGGKTTIRGTSSLYAETDPLLVVDGIPIEGSIDDLNPYDIESVNVLKDAAANAIYGARASNGVIVVTTKNAKEKGKIDINFSTNLTVYEKKNMDYADNFYMTPAQQVDVEAGYWNYYFFDNDGEITDPLNSASSSIESGTDYISPIQYAYYRLALGEISCHDLQQTLNSLRQNNFAKEYGDAVYKNQILQQYNLALRSRSDKFTSNLVLNYKYDNSGQINTYDRQFNVNYKGSYDVASWLTASFSVNGIYTWAKEPGED